MFHKQNFAFFSVYCLIKLLIYTQWRSKLVFLIEIDCPTNLEMECKLYSI